MAEKKSTVKAAPAKKAAAPAKKAATPAKKTTASAKKAPAKKASLAINTQNVGFKAGDVYQALAASKKALSVAEIAKAAKISNEEVLLGLGWLLKEGKVKDEAEKVTLA